MKERIKLVILDRDGVINNDSDEYIKSPDEWHPIEGSLQAIKKLNDAGMIVTVATNQSGVGRGYYSLAVLAQIHEKMAGLMRECNAHLDCLVFCPHTPDDHCDCRKPKPGMIAEILSRYPQVQPSEVLMIGDSLRDCEAAWAMHCNAVLVRTGKGERTLAKDGEALKDTMVFDDLDDAIGWLLG